MIELAKAIAIAELEIDGEYQEARHESVFADFGANGLDARDTALFPDYLVALNAADMTPAETTELAETFFPQACR